MEEINFFLSTWALISLTDKNVHMYVGIFTNVAFVHTQTQIFRSLNMELFENCVYTGNVSVFSCLLDIIICVAFVLMQPYLLHNGA